MTNMAIWDAVSKTDPAFTKKVNQRGGFTAIAAHSQIMAATKQFGPVGSGWGYDCGDPLFQGAFIMVPVTLWHGERANRFGPIYGCAEMLGNRPDHDAPKKAMTDAITKGLSQIGFNADVFLGRFDDNKYVAEVAREFAANDATERVNNPTPAPKREAPVKLAGPYTSKTALWAAVRKFSSELHGCGDSDMLEAFLAEKESVALLEQCERDAPNLLRDSDIPDYVPLDDLIAKMRNDFELIENNTLRAG